MTTNLLIIGDSIFYDADFKSAIESLTTYDYVGSTATGGVTLDNIEGQYDTYATSFDLVVADGGTNNIIFADTDPNTTMRASMQSIIDDSITDGIELIVTNIPPFGGAAQWNQDRQDWLESYNTWLASYCSTNSIQHIDAYTILKDSSTVYIASEYFEGDYIHPNAAGSQAIAAAMDFGEFAYIRPTPTVLPIKFNQIYRIYTRGVYRNKFRTVTPVRYMLFDVTESTLLPNKCNILNNEIILGDYL